MELNNPEQCFRQNIYATHNVKEAFGRIELRQLFSHLHPPSIARQKKIPTPEENSPLDPISIYGASKLASEALVTSYCHAFNKRCIILRLTNVIGPGSNHGVVSEFVNKLIHNPRELSMLGDGTQTKFIVYIDDCISAIMAIMKTSHLQLKSSTGARKTA